MAPIREKSIGAKERVTAARAADQLAGVRKPRQDDDAFEVLRGGVTGAVNKVKAVATCDAVLVGPKKFEWDRETGTYVLFDPQDANNPNDVDANSKRFASAQNALATNGAAESRALERLSPEEQSQYLALKQQLLLPAVDRPQGDPVSVLALQKLLLQGKLPGTEALVGGQSLLSGLYNLASAPLQDGVNRTQMLCDLVQEVATPECINQNGPTCVATSTQIHLMQHNPAEFVRLFTGLVGPEGRVVTAGGDELVRDSAKRRGEPASRDANGTDGIIAGPEDGDTLTQEIMGAALTEFANGDADYNGSSGLDAVQADRLDESLWGQSFDVHEFEGTSADEAELDALIDRARGGDSFFVGVRQMDGYSGHKLLVTGTLMREGEEYVTYVNPWGRVEAMPLDAFRSRIRNANVGTTAATT